MIQRIKQKLHKKKKHWLPPTALIILDGFGLADPHNRGNAITPKTAPNIFGYMKKYPTSHLKTYGKHVGLFPGQQGNSEAGHLNIGAGRVVKQDLVTISDAIEDGTFYKNEAFKQALHHIKKYKTAVHIMGLLTDTNSAHAYPEHLYETLDMLHREKVKQVYIHLITDGRDSLPHGSSGFLKKLRKHMHPGQEIASVVGRFYTMDRNKIWERTQAAYNMMVLGKGMHVAESAEKALSHAHERGETDEYIQPTVIQHNKKSVGIITDNDAIIFINTRSDRARQITKAFVQPDFNKMNPGSFKRKRRPKNIRFVAMTDFGPDLPGIFTAFPSPDIQMCLPLAIGETHQQLYISETEKYAHVTYFINGGFPDPLNGEKRQLIKSPPVHSYAKKPEMSTKKMVNTMLGHIDAHRYDFICVNFPNADMVGHTGDFEAAKKAVHFLDGQIKRLVDNILQKNGQALIIADHGNAEEMLNLDHALEKMTEHTTNPVPCILIRKNTAGIILKDGKLADVAPTVLKMLGKHTPDEMTGKALF